MHPKSEGPFLLRKMHRACRGFRQFQVKASEIFRVGLWGGGGGVEGKREADVELRALTPLATTNPTRSLPQIRVLIHVRATTHFQTEPTC